MRILIAAVGRAGKDPAQALFDHYRWRSRWPIEIREVAERKPLPPADLKVREAELLLATLPRSGGLRVVALDEAGESLGSRRFAERLARWRDQGVDTVAFLIGGAWGHGPAIAGRADLVLSLGPMTWPHLLARAMLAEQLYRAQQILAGHPYHHE